MLIITYRMSKVAISNNTSDYSSSSAHSSSVTSSSASSDEEEEEEGSTSVGSSSAEQTESSASETLDSSSDSEEESFNDYSSSSSSSSEIYIQLSEISEQLKEVDLDVSDIVNKVISQDDKAIDSDVIVEDGQDHTDEENENIVEECDSKIHQNIEKVTMKDPQHDDEKEHDLVEEIEEGEQQESANNVDLKDDIIVIVPPVEHMDNIKISNDIENKSEESNKETIINTNVLNENKFENINQSSIENNEFENLNITNTHIDTTINDFNSKDICSENSNEFKNTEVKEIQIDNNSLVNEIHDSLQNDEENKNVSEFNVEDSILENKNVSKLNVEVSILENENTEDNLNNHDSNKEQEQQHIPKEEIVNISKFQELLQSELDSRHNAVIDGQLVNKELEDNHRHVSDDIAEMRSEFSDTSSFNEMDTESFAKPGGAHKPRTPNVPPPTPEPGNPAPYESHVFSCANLESDDDDEQEETHHETKPYTATTSDTYTRAISHYSSLKRLLQTAPRLERPQPHRHIVTSMPRLSNASPLQATPTRMTASDCRRESRRRECAELMRRQRQLKANLTDLKHSINLADRTLTESLRHSAMYRSCLDAPSRVDYGVRETERATDVGYSSLYSKVDSIRSKVRLQLESSDYGRVNVSRKVTRNVGTGFGRNGTIETHYVNRSYY